MNKRTDAENRELRKGESQRKDGTYMYRYTDFQGNRRCIYDTNLESLRKKEQQIYQDENYGVTTDMTLNEQFVRYMKLKTRISDSTRTGQSKLWEHHVESSIGELPIAQIRKSDILSFYRSLSDEKRLKNSTIQCIHHLLSPCFELAVDDDFIRKNPCKGCMKEYPGDTAEKHALTSDEEHRFLEYVKSSTVYHIYYPLFAFMLETALRRGEVIGLTWEDVDLTHKSISINHQLQYQSTDGKMRFYATTPKSDAGVRNIPLTGLAVDALTAQKTMQESTPRCAIVEIDGYSDFVFTTKKNTPYIPSNLNAVLKEIVDAYNKEENIKKLPHISAHILRHTACTRMAEAGIDPKVLQYIMGHSSISVTMDVYNHVSEERNRKELNRIEKRRRMSR